MRFNLVPCRNGLVMAALSTILGSAATVAWIWSDRDHTAMARAAWSRLAFSRLADPVEMTWAHALERWFEEVIAAELLERTWSMPDEAVPAVRTPAEPTRKVSAASPLPLTIRVDIAPDGRIGCVAPVRSIDRPRVAALDAALRGRAVPLGGTGWVQLLLWAGDAREEDGGAGVLPAPLLGSIPGIANPGLEIEDAPASPFLALARRLLAGLARPAMKGAMI